ncbi:MAG: hypothetical protein RR229_02355 [Oscillospiraceae bacterium]
MSVNNTHELVEAIKRKNDTITIEGDLANKTFRICATGKIAWAVALTAIGISVAAVALTIPTGGTSNAFHLVTVPAATIAFGSASSLAVGIATIGGTATLKALKKYDIEKVSKDKVILYRKK